ncbi:hypothetical protein KIPB_005485, partial [Kipferlia bialata]
GGAVTEACNPYTASDEACSDICDSGEAPAYRYPAQTGAYEYLMRGTYSPDLSDAEEWRDIVKAEVYGGTPVGVSIYSNFSGTSPGSTPLYKVVDTSYSTDHAVVVVGWGEAYCAETGQTEIYWEVANSWGNWGDDGGYFKIFDGSLNFLSWPSLLSVTYPVPREIEVESSNVFGPVLTSGALLLDVTASAGHSVTLTGGPWSDDSTLSFGGEVISSVTSRTKDTITFGIITSKVTSMQTSVEAQSQNLTLSVEGYETDILLVSSDVPVDASTTLSPLAVVAGVATTFTVVAQDTYGNTVTSGTVDCIASWDSGFSDPVSFPYSATAGGFSGVMTPDTTAGGVTMYIRFYDAGTTDTIATISRAITLGSGLPDDSNTTLTPLAATTGVATTFTVVAADVNGNTVSSGSAQCVLSLDSSLASPTALSYAVGVGYSGTFLAGSTPGPVTVYMGFSDLSSNHLVTLSRTVYVTDIPPAGASLSPTSAVAGESTLFSVTALDSESAPITSNLACEISAFSDFTTYTSLSLASGETAFTGSMDAPTSAGSATVYIRFISTYSNTVVGTFSDTISVSPAAPDATSTTLSPIEAVAGESVTWTVTSTDTYGNTITGDYSLELSTFSAFTTSSTMSYSAGTGFSGSMSAPTMSGSQLVYGRFTANGSFDVLTSFQQAVTVSPGDPVASSTTLSPLVGVAGTSTHFTVTSSDTHGNTITAGVDCSLSLSPTFASGVSSVSYTSGVGYVGDLALGSTYGAQTVYGRFTETGTSTLVASFSDVVAAVADIPVVSSTTLTPTLAVAGASTEFTVTSRDSHGNAVSDTTVTCEISSDAAFTSVVALSYTTGTGFVGSLTVRTLAGSQSIYGRFKDLSTGNVLITFSESVIVQPAAPDPTRTTLSPLSLVAGVSTLFSVTSKDQYGNTVSTTVDCSLSADSSFTSSGALSLSGTTFSGSADAPTTAGTQTMYGRFTTPATSTVVTSFSVGVTVSASDPVAASTTLSPTEMVAGEDTLFTVTSTDAYGNTIVGGVDCEITTYSFSNQSVLPYTHSLPGFSGSMVANTLAGNQKIYGKFYECGTTTIITAFDISVKVLPAAPVASGVSLSPSVVPASDSTEFTVTASDQYGNIVSTTASCGAGPSFTELETFSYGAGLGYVGSVSGYTVAGAQSLAVKFSDAVTETTLLELSLPFTVVPSTPIKSSISLVPDQMCICAGATLTVSGTDMYGNSALSESAECTLSTASDFSSTATSVSLSPVSGAGFTGMFTHDTAGDLTVFGRFTSPGSSEVLLSFSRELSVLSSVPCTENSSLSLPTGSVVAGEAFEVSVSTCDECGNTLNPQRSDALVSLYINDTLSSTTYDTTAIAYTVSATRYTAGDYSVSAVYEEGTEGEVTFLSGYSISVGPAAADAGLSVLDTPAELEAKTDVTLTVSLKDAYSNTISESVVVVGLEDVYYSLVFDTTSGLYSTTVTLPSAGVHSVSVLVDNVHLMSESITVEGGVPIVGIALVIAAGVVVIGGTGAAVHFLRKPSKEVPDVKVSEDTPPGECGEGEGEGDMEEPDVIEEGAVHIPCEEVPLDVEAVDVVLDCAPVGGNAVLVEPMPLPVPEATQLSASGNAIVSTGDGSGSLFAPYIPGGAR